MQAAHYLSLFYICQATNLNQAGFEEMQMSVLITYPLGIKAIHVHNIIMMSGCIDVMIKI